MKKVAIIGYGWVGKAMHTLFPDAHIYSPGVCKNSDENWVEGYPEKDWYDLYEEEYKKMANECDIAFICVPTPNKELPNPVTNVNQLYETGEGELDTGIVEEVVEWCECPLLVVRSTVNPGDCDKWMSRYSKSIVMQPEYLGETPAHPMLDMKLRPFIVLGGHSTAIRKLVELYTTVYNANISITQLSAKEAEIVKLSENRAIAYKVAQCQELYDVCEKEGGVDYYKIRDAVYGDDPRFNLYWTFIYPDKRGMNSKCIPKDVYAWCAWAESLGYDPKLTRALLEKNKEWIKSQS